ncbi:neurotrimin-like protein [Dinothrombium tinctorium]|uniref:Neurotrimin-like protein n=1 Tax=Dinothrombium tinctorium TaxID=1965070 RepID=A0A443QZ22_9ACAR|nr:neurotrimin-like protein [Dinothrombium tinctorium]
MSKTPQPLCYAWKLCAYIAYTLLVAGGWRAYALPEADGDTPYFVETLANITVPVGRDAIFQCVVRDLGQKYQIAWFHKDKHTLLALQDKVIFRNNRIRVNSHASSTFYLIIHDVREEDRGEYMCQINTLPVKSMTGYLHVVVPPRLREATTSNDTEVHEDESVVLRCEAEGFPRPEIKWRREDHQAINVQSVGSSTNNRKVTTIHGEFLNITKATRLHMGAYICIASNGIPPSVSKRIFLGVSFSPLIWTPTQMVGAPLGSDVTLECNLESHPRSVTYWTKNSGQQIIVSNSKYDSVIVEGTSSVYKSEMRLRIKDLKPLDFTDYACIAKNQHGEAQGTIRLYEIPKPSTQTSDVMSFTSSSRENTNRNRNHFFYIGTKSSLASEDTQSERVNKAIVLTDAHGNEITSEYITLQSEEKSTLHSMKTDSNSAHSEVRKPRFGKRGQNITRVEGQSVTFRCVVKDIGRYQVAWYKKDDGLLLVKNGTVVYSKGRLLVSNYNNTYFYLHKSNIEAQDAGEYSCEVNTKPVMSQSSFLRVIAPPRIIFINEDLTVSEGLPTSLICEVTGFPKPEITWTREDGEPITQYINETVKNDDIYYKVIQFDQVKFSDSGLYTCVASAKSLKNETSVARDSVVLQVVGKPKATVANKIINATIGSDVKLSCLIEANPEPDYGWVLNAEKLITPSQTHIIQTEFVSSVSIKLILIIKNMKESDFGKYSCFSTNKFGSRQEIVIVNKTEEKIKESVRESPKESSKEGEKEDEKEDSLTVSTTPREKRSSRFIKQSAVHAMRLVVELLQTLIENKDEL